MNEENIDHTEVKANYAERVIKTIKTKLYRYITYKQSYNYVDKLQDLAKNYNATYHRKISMASVKVTFGAKCYGPKRHPSYKNQTSKEIL